MATRPGRRYELVDDTELVINDWVAALCRMVGCAECGAETGELCDRTAEKVNYAHAERRAAAKSDVGGEGRCKECRFVGVVAGALSEVRRRGRHSVVRGPAYVCRRWPPRRGIGDEYHLTEVDPLGWCGEFRPARWVRDVHEQIEVPRRARSMLAPVTLKTPGGFDGTEV